MTDGSAANHGRPSHAVQTKAYISQGHKLAPSPISEWDPVVMCGFSGGHAASPGERGCGPTIQASLTCVPTTRTYGSPRQLLNAAQVFREPVQQAFQQFISMGAEAVDMTMIVSSVCTCLAAITIPLVCIILKLPREGELPGAYQPPIKEKPQ